MTTRAHKNSPRLIIVGDYLFDPGVGLISGPSGAHYVSPHLSDLLCTLVENGGEVVAHDYLHPGQPLDGANGALCRRVARLRRYFRDSPRAPSYIETVPNQGYRLIAPVYGSTATPVIERKPRPEERVQEPGRLFRLVNEFRERKVCRSMLIYSAVVWLIYEFTDLVIPALGLPDWVITLVVFLGILGFPIAATLSWMFDITPGGLVRDHHGDHSPATAGRRKRDLVVDFALVASAVAICAMLIVSSQTASAPEAQADALDEPRTENIKPADSGNGLDQVFRNQI